MKNMAYAWNHTPTHHFLFLLFMTVIRSAKFFFALEIPTESPSCSTRYRQLHHRTWLRGTQQSQHSHTFVESSRCL